MSQNTQPVTTNANLQTPSQQNNGITPLSAVVVKPKDPVLEIRYIQPYQLKIFRKGASDSRRFTIGLALLSAAAGFLGSMITTVRYSNEFWVYCCLICLCIGSGILSLIYSKQDKNEVLETVKEIEDQLLDTPAGTQMPQ